jgi:hypothetical protein
MWRCLNNCSLTVDSENNSYEQAIDSKVISSVKSSLLPDTAAWFGLHISSEEVFQTLVPYRD